MPRPITDKKGTLGPGELVVTTQQSRFHADANDTPESKAIDLKDVTVSIGGNEILDHASLRIREATNYVFVGRNGTGKSTLLRALAERRVPGVPSNLRIMLLGQTRIDTDLDFGTEEISSKRSTAISVLQYVLESNTRRERALREAERNELTKAFNNVKDSSAIATVVQDVELKRLQNQLAEMQLIAARRSGARGLKARQDVIAKEQEVLVARVKSQGAPTAEEIAAAHEKGTFFLDEIQLSLEAMDAGVAEAKARTILLGLGFANDKIGQPYESLSGGWRTRCDLAIALTQKTDVLLLDEPTNFLDMPAVLWLQDFICNELQSTSVVVVTHDREFADAVGEELLLLRLVPAKTLETFKGKLSDYESEKRRQIRRMMKMKEAQDKKTKHMEETIASNVRTAKRTGDDKKLKQAASRRKRLDERTGLEVNAKGGRFKLSRDRAGFHLSKRGEIAIPELDPPVTLVGPSSPAPLRFPGPVVSLEKVTYRYPNAKEDVLKGVDLIIHPGARVGVVGLNGCGKSTLVNLIIGSDKELVRQPTKGTITKHSRASIGHYSQHAVERIEKVGLDNPSLSALSYFFDLGNSELNEQDIRALLSGLGLRGKIISEVPISALSGGQRVRLALAEAIWQSPHLLILDEVTTHLDSDTIIALIEMLQSWEGALLVVTHDRFFMRCVVEGESLDTLEDSDGEGVDSGRDDTRRDLSPGVVYRMNRGTLKMLEGGMDTYEKLMQQRIAKLAAS